MDILVLALSAALNPTLLAATTVMLLMPQPRSLMLGYLLGAATTSVSLGVVIIYTLEDSGAVNVTRSTLSPSASLVLGCIALVIARALSAERDEILRERRERSKAAHGKRRKRGPPRWQRALSKGSARTTFIVGALLTLPGASYLVALGRLARDDLSVPEVVLAVLGFNLIMLSLLEIPLLSYWMAPEETPERVERSKAWLRRDGRRVAIRVVIVVGVLLIARGVIELAA